jgi:hypothetical protein
MVNSVSDTSILSSQLYHPRLASKLVVREALLKGSWLVESHCLLLPRSHLKLR